MRTIILLTILLFVSGLLFTGLILFQGYTSSHKGIRPCSPNQCIMKADGSQKLCPKSITETLIPNYQYTMCVDSMTCPVEYFAVHGDGSALTERCDVAGCPCSLYRRCPPYILTVFRLFGSEKRTSYFQVIDPLYENPATNPDGPFVSNPFSPPYVLNHSTDYCFISQQQITLIYPFLNSQSNFKNPCIRGVFAEIASKPRTYGCVPEAFVNSTTNIFDEKSFFNSYKL